MNKGVKYIYSQPANGFSLVEVMIAVAILTIALVMVGVSFPVGVAMTTNVAERTIAAVVADEAFAKIRLYGLKDLTKPVGDVTSAWYMPSFPAAGENVRQEWMHFESVGSALPADKREVFAYPSDKGLIEKGESVYYWSALCRRELDSSGNPTRNVRVVVFVSRKVGGENTRYPFYGPDDAKNVPPLIPNDRPKPVLVFRDGGGLGGNGRFDATGDLLDLGQPGSYVPPSRYVQLFGQPVQRTFLNTGVFVLDDTTGELYRVVDRAEIVSSPMTPGFITLDRNLVRKTVFPDTNYKFWEVPPAIGASRNSCIAVYQKVIKF